MGSKQSGTTTTVQKAEPWAGAKPYLSQIYGQAQNLYGNNPQTPFYGLPTPERFQQAMQVLGADPATAAPAFGLSPGYLSTAVQTGVAPFSGEERAARAMRTAVGASPLSPLYGGAQARTGATLANPLGQQGAQASGYYSNTLQGNTLPAALLGQTATGQYLGSNPYLEAAFQGAARPVVRQFTEQVLPAISAQFSAAGRYGSGAQTRAVDQSAYDLARSLADASSRMYQGSYEAERSRQVGAQNALANVYGSAARGLLGAGAQSSRIGLAASTLAPSVAGAEREAILQNAGILQNVAEQRRKIARQLLGQITGTYGQTIAEPWQRLGAYSDLVAGLPSSSMATRSSEQPYYSNPLAGGLGGALMGGLGGYGLATGVAALNPYMAPLIIGGALAGGGLGLFG